MKRVSGVTLLLICLFCFSTFARGQTLEKATVPTEKEGLKENRSGNQPVVPKAPQTPTSPIIKNDRIETPGRSVPTPHVKPRGSLKKLGERVFFLLDKPAAKMEVYSGKRKLGQFGGGIQFDLTPYLRMAKGGMLTLKYVDASGKQYTEELKSGEYQSLSKPKVPQKLAPQPGPGDPPPPPPNMGTINVTSPKAGDHVFQGTDLEIKLQGQGNIPEPCYGIYLYQGSTQVMHIVLQKCGPTHTWHVPSTVSGPDFRIRIITLDNNIMAESASFPILTSAPDLSVTNVHINPANPDTADTITFHANVSNGGMTRADGVRAEMKIQAPDNSETIYRITLPGLAFGDHRPVQKSFRLPKAGQYTVSLTAEVTLSTALETRMDNNTATAALQVAGLPDLRVCLHQTRNVQIDHWEYINVNVENIGEATSPSTTLDIWIDNRGTETIQVPGLIPGSHNIGHRYEMWISRSPSRDYWAEVDPDNNVRESDEGNNKKTGVIVKHLTNHSDSNYSCAGFPITGYPVYEVE
jgi:CARDB